MGVVTGDYTDTIGSDNVYESIKEAQFGTFWEVRHQWTIPITSNTNKHLFSVEAFHTTNGSDNFIFSYSTDAVTYTPMVTVTKIADDNTAQTFALPSSLPSIVYIRVIDTFPAISLLADHAVTINIDDMFIESKNTCGIQDPPLPNAVKNWDLYE